MPERQLAFVRAQGLAATLRVRLVKIDLADGEVEVLATSLLDATAVSVAMLKTL